MGKEWVVWYSCVREVMGKYSDFWGWKFIEVLLVGVLNVFLGGGNSRSRSGGVFVCCNGRYWVGEFYVLIGVGER